MSDYLQIFHEEEHGESCYWSYMIENLNKDDRQNWRKTQTVGGTL